MTARCILPGLLVAALAPLVSAQTPDEARDAACLAFANALDDVRDDPFGAGSFDCGDLAVLLQDRIWSGVEARLDAPRQPLTSSTLFSARDVQPARSQTASTGGSAAQAEAVPSVLPIPLAGGSLAAVGDGDGAKAIAALSLNPAALFLGGAEIPEVAEWQRLADVTLLVPVDLAGADLEEGIEYVGVRVRVDGSKLGLSTALSADRLNDVVAAGNALFEQDEAFAAALEQTLLSLDAEDVEECAAALAAYTEGTPAGTIQAACGEGAVPLAAFVDPTVESVFRAAVQAALAEADERYFGLDLRGDFGDPTLGAAPDQDGTRLFGGLALGRRVGSVENGRFSGVRLNVGLLYADLDLDGAEPQVAFEGAFGYEVARTYGLQILSLQLGIDGRVGGDLIETDYLIARGALNVPLADAYSVSLTAGVPFIGGDGPTLSLNANWGLPWTSR